MQIFTPIALFQNVCECDDLDLKCSSYVSQAQKLQLHLRIELSNILLLLLLLIEL